MGGKSIHQPIKLVALNGSPNKNGNTATIMRWVVEGAVETGTAKLGPVTCTWIDVAERNIEYCRGCYHCLRHRRCVIRDGMDEIMNLLRESDGAIVGSPVYEGAPSAQMKTVMDRISLFCLYRGIFDNKHAVGVATSGVAPTKRTAKDCAMMFGRSSGLVRTTTASLSGGYTDVDMVNYPKIRKRALKTGRQLVRDIRSPGRLSGSSVKYAWIGWLRRNFLKKLLVKHPEQFKGVLDDWKAWGWLQE